MVVQFPVGPLHQTRLRGEVNGLDLSAIQRLGQFPVKLWQRTEDLLKCRQPSPESLERFINHRGLQDEDHGEPHALGACRLVHLAKELAVLPRPATSVPRTTASRGTSMLW